MQIILRKCQEYMEKCEDQFENLKNLSTEVNLRKLFDLPYGDTVHRVNEMMLAVDFDSIEKHGNDADETNESNEISQRNSGILR